MNSAEIRENFLKYFEGKGHRRLPGSSLVPSDPTVLLTLAGMLQFKPIFLGLEQPKEKRAATVQKCLRTNDIEQVGRTARHHTFFEMLGNFSFGDYFKAEAIQFAWELLTRVLQVPADRLLAAVYEKDDEAFDLWRKEIGLPEERIFRLGADNNFWAVGPTGPCGPCSELYYDLGPGKGCGKPGCAPGCDCDRFLEVWNLVFIQFNRNGQGELIPLKQKGIDTGMGLERIASVLQGVDSNFATDLFVPLIQWVKEKAKEKDQARELSYRIIADHARAATHLIGDGVLPDNSGRGYILRRLIRRAVRHGKLVGIDRPFLAELANEVIIQMKGPYPVLERQAKLIDQTLRGEESAFRGTLEQGMSLFNEVMRAHAADKVIPGAAVFKLHDTYGFPVDLSNEIAVEAGYRLDQAVFEQEMNAQRERARAAGLTDDKKKLLTLELDRFSVTKFVGYEKHEEQARIVGFFPEQRFVILEKTPFYGESGGQAGDTGLLEADQRTYRVVNTLNTPRGVIVHELDKVDGLKEGRKVRATIDASQRQATEKHHTATHLLHKALREVLGAQVKQAGSYVGPDKLRFDFNHSSGLSREELGQVEAKVNRVIHAGMKVEVLQKSYQEAVKLGAMALFGEKYGDRVRVLKVGDYSLEFCGGTHVRNTGDILFFKIISEGALGAGVRRIEAVAGQAAKVFVVFRAKSLYDEVNKLIRQYRLLELEKEPLGGQKFTETNIFQIELTEIDRLGASVENQDSVNVDKFLEHMADRVDWLKERIAKAEREIKNLQLKSAGSQAADLGSELAEIKGVKVLTKQFSEYSMEMLRSAADTVRNQAGSCVLVLASSFPGRLLYLIIVTDDLVQKGLSAKKLAELFASVVQGKGGGNEAKAEGGGNDPARIEAGLARVREALAA